MAVIGGPDTVQQKLARFLSLTNVDELIFASDLYDHRDQLRSFEIAAEATKMLDKADLQRI
jgi:alkanesulfonate monooxygenase SsuD/methylene tetrahydromethanopterin reductase-like flavin-dependent oxidoreductase (luciferase family)